MGTARAISAYQVWDSGTHGPRIETAAAALEQIRAAAVEGFCRFPRGGVEVGGVLYGRAADRTVRIVAARPLSCEYRFGPSFALSELDERQLNGLLAAAGSDPKLEGLEVVGWYRSRTRSELSLSESDVALQRGHFPKPWQVILVVQPEPFGSVRACYFVREPDGSVRAGPAKSEFVIKPSRGGRLQQNEPAAMPVLPARRSPPPRPAESTSRPIPAAPEAFRRPPAPRRAWTRIALPAIGLMALAIGAFAWLSPSHHQPLSLRALDVNGELQIAWNRMAEPIRSARSAALEITDGGQQTQFPLDAAGLERGRLTYSRRSDDVAIRLRVEPIRGAPQEESVRFVGQAPEPRVDPPPSVPESIGERSVPRPKERAARPPIELRPDPARRPPPRPFNIAELRPRFPNKPSPIPAPPPVTGAVQHAAAAPVLGSETVLPPPPVTAQRAAASAPARLAPRSGRMVWAGRLPAGATIEIDGAYLSSGALNGALPGAPVWVSAHPAELTARGLVVYTAAAGEHHERPGAANGWNETTYTRAPRRAGALLVLDSPAARNGWRRLVVRNVGPPLSLIVVDWRRLD